MNTRTHKLAVRSKTSCGSHLRLLMHNIRNTGSHGFVSQSGVIITSVAFSLAAFFRVQKLMCQSCRFSTQFFPAAASLHWQTLGRCSACWELPCRHGQLVPVLRHVHAWARYLQVWCFNIENNRGQKGELENMNDWKEEKRSCLSAMYILEKFLGKTGYGV